MEMPGLAIIKDVIIDLLRVSYGKLKYGSMADPWPLCAPIMVPYYVNIRTFASVSA